MKRDSLQVNYPLDSVTDFLACSSGTLGSFGYDIPACTLLRLCSASASPGLFDTELKGSSTGRVELLLPPCHFVDSSRELCRENTFGPRLKHELENS